MTDITATDIAKKKDRNYGIDMLRIVSMIMIVLLHLMKHGGILDNIDSMSASGRVAWFVETGAFCAVNCYALISGFVGYGRKFKYKSIISLYLQIVFYMLLFDVIFAGLGISSIGLKDLLKALFPFLGTDYWYVTAYFGMFLFIPFAKYVVENMPQEWMGRLVLSTVLVFSVVPTVSGKDLFNTNNGFSGIWLFLMYTMGACIRRMELTEKVKGWWCVCTYLLCVIVSWGVKCVCDLTFLINYTSPTILLAAISLLLCFAKLKIGKTAKCVVSFFAPLTFGVYLIHEHPLVRENIIINHFAGFAEYSPVKLVIASIATAVIIWMVCSLIDKLRQLLFSLVKKLCGVFTKDRI